MLEEVARRTLCCSVRHLLAPTNLVLLNNELLNDEAQPVAT